MTMTFQEACAACLRARHPIRDPGGRCARRADQGLRRHPTEPAVPLRRRRCSDRRLHRLRGRALGDAEGYRADRPDRARAGARTRRREGRSSGDRDAQLPGVDRRLRGDHVGRRDRRADERLVADRRDGVRPRRFRCPGGVRRRRSTRTHACRRARRDLGQGGDRSRRRIRVGPTTSSRSRTCSSRVPRCPTSRSIPTTMPPSSTPRAPPGIRRARSRRTGRCSSALMAFAARGAVNALREPEEPDPDRPQTAFMLCVPLFHVTGLVPVMLGAFVGGSKLVMTYKWDPERALELIEQERVTSFVGVPTMSWDLLESPSFAERDTSSLRSVGGGGAPMPPELVKRIDDNFRRGRPSLGYGMTETNAYGPRQQRRRLHVASDLHGPAGARDGHQGDRSARQRSAAGRNRRDLVPRSDAHSRLLEPPRGHRRHDRRRVVALGRHRSRRRRRLRVRQRPREGHDPARRREHLLRRGRGGDLRAPGRVRGCRVRHPARTPRRGTGVPRDGQAGARHSRSATCSVSWANASRTSRCRPGSRSSPSSCRGTRRARSSNANSATP